MIHLLEIFKNFSALPRTACSKYKFSSAKQKFRNLDLYILRGSLLSLAFLIPLVIEAQIIGRKPKDMFPEKRLYKQSFWYFGPGINYSLTGFFKKETDLGPTPSGQAFAVHKGHGLPGGFAEIGRYHMINNSYLFRYFNYGISWRWIQGREDFENQLRKDDEVTPTGSGKSKFSDHFINAQVEIHHVIYINDYQFIDNSLGAHAGYAMLSDRSGPNPAAGSTQKFADPFTAYLYYKIGYGIKKGKKLIIIPSLEIPLLNLWQFNGRWDLPYFNSNFLPLTFSIRFIPFRKRPWDDCPPVKSIELPEGFDPNEPAK